MSPKFSLSVKNDQSEAGRDDRTRLANQILRPGRGPVDEHRMGMGTGTGTEARTVAEMGTGTIKGTRIGLGRAEGR